MTGPTGICCLSCKSLAPPRWASRRGWPGRVGRLNLGGARPKPESKPWRSLPIIFVRVVNPAPSWLWIRAGVSEYDLLSYVLIKQCLSPSSFSCFISGLRILRILIVPDLEQTREGFLKYYSRPPKFSPPGV